MNKWVDAMDPVLKEILATSEGKINKEFWQNIYKRSEASGGPYIFGWII